MSPSSTTLGQRVASRRAALGLTQRALAERCGLTINTVSAVENDQQENPSKRTLELLSKHLDVSIDALVGARRMNRRVSK